MRICKKLRRWFFELMCRYIFGSVSITVVVTPSTVLKSGTTRLASNWDGFCWSPGCKLRLSASLCLVVHVPRSSVVDIFWYIMSLVRKLEKQWSSEPLCTGIYTRRDLPCLPIGAPHQFRRRKITLSPGELTCVMFYYIGFDNWPFIWLCRVTAFVRRTQISFGLY